MHDDSHRNSGRDPLLDRLIAVESDIKSGRLREAAATLDALAAANPADFRVHMTAALLGRTAANARLELESLRRAVAAAPRNWRVRVEQAKALSRRDRHAEAVAAAQASVDLAPQELAAMEVAVAVADAAGDLAGAQRYLQAAHDLKPADVAIRRALGVNLARQGRYLDAEPHLRAVLATSPDDLPALEWLGSTLIGLDRRDEALAVLHRVQALAPDDPNLPFHLALARGETPATQPDAMVRAVFDAYAHRFDGHLLGKLHYRVPQRMAGIIRTRMPVPSSVLDLGCGTGLVGKFLGGTGAKLVGVDLSPRMLERARRLGVYADLRCAPLLDELHATAPESVDFITAADVFIYVGDLGGVIPAAFAALRRGGALIFSCELAADDEGALVLRASKRYAHSVSSVRALCRAAGFAGCEVEALTLRLENEQPIDGYIAIAEKR